LEQAMLSCLNWFVEWTHNGGQQDWHSLVLSVPLRAINGQR
jgi:hypothetical protein